MNKIETLRADVEAEMEELGAVIDEFEQTVEEVEATLSDSKLEKTSSTERVTVSESAASSVSPAGAD